MKLGLWNDLPGTVSDNPKHHTIFALVHPGTLRVFHVGCSGPHGMGEQFAHLPDVVSDLLQGLMPEVPQVVILQTVDSAPLFAWVKWSKRFRRDIITSAWKEFSTQADILTNSNRVQRAMGLVVPSDAELHEKYHEFNRANPELFGLLLTRTQALKKEGHRVFGMRRILEGVRWDDTETNRTDQYKIANAHTPFYARHLQMTDASLCGLFEMSASVADDLVLDNGCTWQDFAAEHAGDLRFVETPDADEDVEWSY